MSVVLERGVRPGLRVVPITVDLSQRVWLLCVLL
jgi:hypothetical protein